MFSWFMGIQEERGQGMGWQRQGVSFPNTPLWGKKKNKKKRKKGIHHRKDKANYFSSPYKWNSMTNSPEALSRASVGAGLAAPIQKAGAELEVCCDCGGSTQ